MSQRDSESLDEAARVVLLVRGCGIPDQSATADTVRLRRPVKISPPDFLTARQARVSGLLDTDVDLLFNANRINLVGGAGGDGRCRNHARNQGPHDVAGGRQACAVRLRAGVGNACCPEYFAVRTK